MTKEPGRRTDPERPSEPLDDAGPRRDREQVPPGTGRKPPPETERRPTPDVVHEPEPDAENLVPAKDEPGTL